RRRFALAPLVHDVTESLGLNEQGPVTLHVEIEQGLEVDADPDQLFRVLSNLVRNSAQALEASGPHGQARIAISAWREGSVVGIEVADSGPGLPEAALAHLFEAFQGSAKKGGTGLGLAIAAELVRAHGGSIEHVPVPGGTTFRIFIPDPVVELKAKRRRA
ncbi:MAG: ATP-binding protein, partial [Alphaproteobacteria bacterium]